MHNPRILMNSTKIEKNPITWYVKKHSFVISPFILFNIIATFQYKRNPHSNSIVDHYLIILLKGPQECQLSLAFERIWLSMCSGEWRNKSKILKNVITVKWWEIYDNTFVGRDPYDQQNTFLFNVHGSGLL